MYKRQVLRDDAPVFIEEDGTALADDMLLEPPALMRQCAITAGRRLMKRALDEDADGMVTSLLEDMDDELRLFKA